jgi:hypothetical protein
MALDKSDPFAGLPRKAMFKRAERQSTRKQVDTKMAVTSEPVTKMRVTKRNYVTQSGTDVTKQINHSVTPDIPVKRKRGRPLKGEGAMTDAQRQRASRARKRITNPPKRITALQGD